MSIGKIKKEWKTEKKPSKIENLEQNKRKYKIFFNGIFLLKKCVNVNMILKKTLAFYTIAFVNGKSCIDFSF